MVCLFRISDFSFFSFNLFKFLPIVHEVLSVQTIRNLSHIKTKRKNGQNKILKI